MCEEPFKKAKCPWDSTTHNMLLHPPFPSPAHPTWQDSGPRVLQQLEHTRHLGVKVIPVRQGDRSQQHEGLPGLTCVTSVPANPHPPQHRGPNTRPPHPCA
jgi:hypothetical protein